VYVAIGHLSDLGQGNSSEAFLIDVGPTGGSSFSPAVRLVASITPVVDVPEGAVVNFTAEAVSAGGSVVPAAFHWSIGSSSGAFRSSFDWTYSSPSSLTANGTLTVTVSATDLTIGAAANATLELPAFAAVEPGGFSPRSDDLVFTDHGAPGFGVAPLVWNGSATVAGPGTLSVFWAFGSGVENHSTTAQHSFEAGRYTVVVTAVDSWGDNATDLFSVEVLGGLELTASLSATAGSPPLNITFRSNASGGDGPPYQYHWSFGDGGVASSENGTYTFASAGTYLVTLNVTDPGGDSATMNWSVSVGSGGTGFDPVVILAVGAVVGEAFALIAAASRRRSLGGAATP
jgi:chitodextrinase